MLKEVAMLQRVSQKNPKISQGFLNISKVELY